eukprot:m.120502 g.120502  ORF g.120502 m.120502 type:complete len:78 (-) comp14361_c0_seq4:1706-1939(-)
MITNFQLLTVFGMNDTSFLSISHSTWTDAVSLKKANSIDIRMCPQPTLLKLFPFDCYFFVLPSIALKTLSIFNCVPV